MTDEEVAQLINNEFTFRTLGVTEQYHEIHQPVYEKGQLKIDRIDREKQQDQIIAYLPVEGEYFFFAVYIDLINKEIFNIGTESRNTICLRVISEELTSIELQSFTKLTVGKSWNKGDLKPNKKSTYNLAV